MKPADTTEAAEEIVRVTGRWARLSNGDDVTSIPNFVDLGCNEALFAARIDEFQADPANVLNRDGIVYRIPGWKAKG